MRRQPLSDTYPTWSDPLRCVVAMGIIYVYPAPSSNNKNNNNLKQLKELWVDSVGSSIDPKIQEECLPGRPYSIFSATPYQTVSEM